MLRTTRVGFVAAVFVVSIVAAGCSGHRGDMKNGDDMSSGAMNHDDMGDMDHDDMGMDDDGMMEGKVCGGIQGLPCDEGQFCELEPGSCRSADLQGMCVDIPKACTEIYQPVCGCDGKTYGNDCMRKMAAVQKDHDGECKKT